MKAVEEIKNAVKEIEPIATPEVPAITEAKKTVEKKAEEAKEAVTTKAEDVKEAHREVAAKTEEAVLSVTKAVPEVPSPAAVVAPVAAAATATASKGFGLFGSMKRKTADVAPPAPAASEVPAIPTIAEALETVEKKAEEAVTTKAEDVKEAVTAKTEEAVMSVTKAVPEVPSPAAVVAPVAAAATATASKGFGLFGSMKRKTADVAPPAPATDASLVNGSADVQKSTSFFGSFMGGILKSNSSDVLYTKDNVSMHAPDQSMPAIKEDAMAPASASQANAEAVRSFEILMNSSYTSTTYSEEKAEGEDVIRPYRPSASFSVVFFGEKNVVSKAIEHSVPLLGRAKTHRVTLETPDLKKIQKAHVTCDDKIGVFGKPEYLEVYCKATGECYHFTPCGDQVPADAHLSAPSQVFKPTPSSKQAHGYKVTVRTAPAEGEASTALPAPEVSITLCGSKASSKPMRLEESVSTPGSLFQPGQEDVFLVEVAGELGDINKVEVGLEVRKGLRRDTKDQLEVEWKLENVIVEHVTSGEVWTFASKEVITQKRSKVSLSLPKDIIKQTASMRRTAGGASADKIYEVIIGTSYSS
jgi:hypothetical protein